MKFQLFTLLVLPYLIFSCTAGRKDIVPGVSLELSRQRYASISEIQYNIRFSIPSQFSEPVTGHETIHFVWKKSDNPVVLDFNVSIGYLQDLTVNENPVEYDFYDEHIRIDYSYFNEGSNTISITFRAGESSLNRNKDFLYTLFVPDRASTAFPCFDQPNLKAKYLLTLIIPDDWKAIANGRAVSEHNAAGQKVIGFAETKPISTYLFAFTAGKFKTVERTLNGRIMTMLHRETDSTKVADNIDKIFELHAHSIQWLEDYTGILYPFGKFGFALIPSFQYGGMEHPGAITYKASSLFLDPSATQNQLLRRASLIAHETAHMWFGNLVTMDWFNDVWMKEVFANFMAAKIINPIFPEINHDLRFLLAHYPAAYAVDRSKGTHPVQQQLENLKDAGTLYGAIIYQKAPIVIRKLERRIGKESMQEGLQQYLTTYSYKNATWDDLIFILNNKTKDDIHVWSNQWIKEKGMPKVFGIIRTNNDTTIKVLSIYQRDNAREKNIWPQQLSIKMRANDSLYHFAVDFNGKGAQIKEVNGLPEPDFIVFNAEGYGYGYFILGPGSKRAWLSQINDFEDPVFRGVGWLNLWENMLNNRVKPEDVLQTIIVSLDKEKEPLIIQHVLGYLNTLFWMFMTPEQRMKKATEIETLLWTKMEETDNPRLKAMWFRSYLSLAITKPAIESLYHIWQGEQPITGLQLSERDFTDMAMQLAIKDPDKNDKILDRQLERISDPDRKERMIFLMPSLSADQEIRDVFFESLRIENNRQHESWVQDAIGYLHHPLRAGSSEKYILPTLDMLEELQRTGDIFFPKSVLDNTLYGYQTDSAANIVRQFLYRNNHYPVKLKNKILQSADLLFRAEKILSVN